MAATVSAWSKAGAWALDSEENEAELLQPQPNEPAVSDFPSLAVAAATKPNKKKKPQTLSLAEFNAKPVQDLDILSLPTAPRQRTAEELELDRTRIGGGFRSYGGDRPGRNSAPGGDDGSNSRWGSSRVSDETRRTGSFMSRDSNRDLAPSRADEIDNWASVKKSSVGNGFERRERDRGGFFDSQSRADESDSWVSNKSVVEGRRFGSNGGGFERERKVGFGVSGGADSDNWSKKKAESHVGIGSGNGGGGFERERRVGFGTSGAADSDNWNKKKVESNGGSERPGSGSGGGGRPRLVLQPRSISASNQSSPDSGSGNVAKPKGPNPFGEARPREQVLAEKGQDWKKIDEQLESVKIKETVEKTGQDWKKIDEQLESVKIKETVESVKIKETVEKSDGGVGKNGFGSGNGGATSPEDRTERSWRKVLLSDPRPKSAVKVEDEHVEEN